VSCGTGVKVRSRVKTQESDGGKACNGQLSEVKDCPNTENAPFCPATTTTTSPNIVYVAVEPGQDVAAAARAAGVSGLNIASIVGAAGAAADDANKKHEDSLKTADDANKKHEDDASKKHGDDATNKQSTSTAEPKPCPKDKDLKTALESYPSEDTKHLLDAMATLKKATEKANEKAAMGYDTAAKGNKVSDVVTNLHLYATHADDFITSVAAHAAMTKAMSKLLSVDEKNIKVEMILEGAFMTPTWKKQEQGNVKAIVTVQIFENDNIGEPKLLAEGMYKSLTAEKVTAAISTQLAEKGLGGQFQVHATYMSVSEP